MPDELERLRTLYEYSILDTLPEDAFDALVRLAAEICETPIALVSLVDHDRQWFKSSIGLDVCETPRRLAFCHYTIANPDAMLIVPDASLDPRFANNPLVTGEPHIRFYAGAPLVTPSGHALGSLCVIDTVPRQLSEKQLDTLTVLARQVVDQMELRRQMKALQQAQNQIQLYADVFSGSPTGLQIWQLEVRNNPSSLRLVDANPSASRILGQDLQAVIGQPILDIFPNAQTIAQDYAAVVQTQAPRIWEELFYEDERVKPAYFSVKVYPLPNQCLGVAFSDVTRRVLAEKELRASQARLEALVEVTNDCLWEWNLASNTVQWLYGLESLFGYCETETPLSWWQQRVHPVDRVIASNTLLAAAESKDQNAWDATYRFLKADGEYAIVMDRGLIERDESGTAIRMLGGISDVTPQYQMQTALEQASQRLESHVQNSPLAVVEWDRDLRVRRWSKRAEEMFGWLAADVLGLQPQEFHFVHEDDQARIGAILVDMYAGKLPQAVVRNRNYTASGEILECEWYNSMLFDAEGNVISLLTLTANITAAAKAEHLLRDQAELLDVATDAIAVVTLSDADISLAAPFHYWNRSAEKLFGYGSAEVLGKTPLELWFNDAFQGKSPLDLSLITATLAKQGAWRCELKLPTATGTILILDSRWTVVYDDFQRPRSLLIVNTDITVQKTLELQMLRSQRLESVGTLASGIAHDLNNVFSPILMAVGLLQETLSLDERSQRWLETLHASAHRGANLVKQVLSFARGIESERALMQAKYIVDEVAQVARETFPKTIQVKVQGDKPWLISADATQLHQVLMNLLVNARDAMPNGGTIAIQLDNVVLDDTFVSAYTDAEPGYYIAIAVTDQGCGMSAEILERIFEPFYTTKALGQGTGLGLSTTLGIIRNHGGLIAVSSEVNQGSCFKIYLPSVSNHTQIDDLSEPAELQHGQGETILLVDDEDAVRELVVASLTRYGYSVIEAKNGVEALIKLADTTIDLAIIDMMMPIMGGAKTIFALRRLHPNLKVIAMSGESHKSTEAQAFLAKPFTVENLINTVATVLKPD